MRLAFAAAALAALAAPLVTPTEARACSCFIDDETRVLLPAPDQGPVPLDARIVLQQRLAAEEIPRLVADGGEEVEVTLERRFDRGPARVEVFAPVGDLAPNTTYRVELASAEEPVATFTTGDGPDTLAPPIPGFGSIELHESGGGFFGGISSCGETRVWNVPIRFTQLDSPMLLLVEVDGHATSETGEIGGVLGRLDVVRAGATSTEVGLGDLACEDTDGADEGSNIRVGLMDVAGRFSGWSKTRRLEDGCQGGLAGDGAAPVGLALLMLAWARARRSARQSG